MKRETIPVFRARRDTVSYEERLLATGTELSHPVNGISHVTVTSRNVTVTSPTPDEDAYEEYSLDLDEEETQVRHDCIPVSSVRANDSTLVVSFDLGVGGERILVFQGSREETALVECFVGDIQLALARGVRSLSSSRRSGR